ncbi:MAG: uridylate kinase [Hyphomicrobiaceae bacterium]
MSIQASSSLIVVKVGGSLVRTGCHRAVLAVLARACRPIVIVPGGGALVDHVRRLQKQSGFSDQRAHQMALAGMAEMAQVMAGLSPRFVVANTPLQIKRAVACRQVVIWSPNEMMANDFSLPHDWSVTSDALSACLAERLAVPNCLLVKSHAVAPGWSWPVLARRGTVDPWFGRVLQRAGLKGGIRGARELGQLAQDVDAVQ